MTRRLFATALMASLLVCIGTAAMLVRSYVWPEVLYFWWDPHRQPQPTSMHGEVYGGVILHRSFEIESNGGVLTAGTGVGDGPIKAGRLTMAHKMLEAPRPSHWPLVSFEMSPRRSRWIPDFRLWGAQVSLLVPLIGFAVPPGAWLLVRVRAGRVRRRGAFPVITRTIAVPLTLFAAVASAAFVLGCGNGRNRAPASASLSSSARLPPDDEVSLWDRPTVLYAERGADLSDMEYCDFVEGLAGQCLSRPAPDECVVVLWPDAEPGPLRVFEGTGSVGRLQKFGSGLTPRYSHVISEAGFETGLKRCVEMALARHAGVVILGREIPSDLGRDPLALLRRLSGAVRISIISYGDSSDLDRMYRENISGLYVTLASGKLDVGSASKP